MPTITDDGGRVSAAETAFRAVRADIINGVLPMGTMLSEHSLGAALGMSRTPIRSALTRLQDEGWVQIFPQRGALVRTLTPTEARDLTDARVVLESSGVLYAPASTRRRLGAELRTSIRDQQAALAATDVRGFIELTTDFHRAFVEASGNTYLIELNHHLADRQRQLLFAAQDNLLARSAEIITEHRELLRHLVADDPGAFTASLRRHLADTLGAPNIALGPRPVTA